MSTVLHEGKHTAEFLISEANGTRSRDTVTLASGNDLEAGTVLGRITASGNYTKHDPEASDGSETARAILYDGVDASQSSMAAVVVAREAEVDKAKLTFADGISQADEDAAVDALADHHIIAR